MNCPHELAIPQMDVNKFDSLDDIPSGAFVDSSAFEECPNYIH